MGTKTEKFMNTLQKVGGLVIGIFVLIAIVVSLICLGMILYWDATDQLSPRGKEINRFCIQEGYDRFDESLFSFNCQKKINNTLYSVEVSWDRSGENIGEYYLISRGDA